MMLAIKSINGAELPCQPLVDGYTVTKSDLLADGSGRSSETGRTLRYPIRLGVYKIELKFKGSPTDIAAVDNLVSAFTQTVIFYDRTDYVTREFYPSDRKAAYRDDIAELSVNLIEI